MALAYKELNVALNGTLEQQAALGPITELPRPWNPETCLDPELRHEVWTWLDEVVVWLNHEHAWDVATVVPSCWPSHPHLVHDLAVIADQRHHAGLALTSDPLEEWHRYCLPAFVDRLRSRLRDHCADGHKGWPSRGRHTRHTSKESVDRREDVYAADLDAEAADRFGVRIDRSTGEIVNDDDR